MAAGSTRHIEPLLPAEVAAAVEQIPDRLQHQVHAGFEPPHNFWLAGWQPPHETPVAPVVKRSPEHLVLLGTTPLPQGEITTWAPTRDTTPKTSRLDHQVTLAMTPLPRGDFISWAPPLVEVTPRIQAHAFSATEDLRRLQRFRLERHGGPAGFAEPPVEDTTRIAPHQVTPPAVTPTSQGDFSDWRAGLDTTPNTGKVSHQATLAQSRYPEGDFFSWGPPHETPVAPRRAPDPQVTLAPSRYPQGGFLAWHPPLLPFTQPNAPRAQVIPPPQDRRGLYRFSVVRFGGPAGFLPEGAETVPACVSISEEGQALVMEDAPGGAVSLSDALGRGVAVVDASGSTVSVEATGDDVEMDDGNPC